MSTAETAVGWSREQIAARCARDIPDGSYVNLGIGIPELVARFADSAAELLLRGIAAPGAAS